MICILKRRRHSLPERTILPMRGQHTEDTEKVTYSKIAGKCVLTIPHLGKIILMLDSKIIVLVIILIILILSFYKIQKYEKMENRREKKKIEENKKGKN